jgi:hypothetical protein
MQLKKLIYTTEQRAVSVPRLLDSYDIRSGNYRVYSFGRRASSDEGNLLHPQGLLVRVSVSKAAQA